MSLPNAPFGFKAIRSQSGGPLRQGHYTLASTSARVFAGDVVALANSTGLVVRHTNSGTERIIGVSARDSGVLSGQIANFPIYDYNDTVFEVQANNTVAITQAKFGNPFRITGTLTGDTVTGISKARVAIATTAASSTYCVFALRLSPKQNNDLALYSVIECVLAGDPLKTPRAG